MNIFLKTINKWNSFVAKLQWFNKNNNNKKKYWDNKKTVKIIKKRIIKFQTIKKKKIVTSERKKDFPFNCFSRYFKNFKLFIETQKAQKDKNKILKLIIKRESSEKKAFNKMIN